MSTDFDAWAEVYDSVYSYVRDDIPFYVGLAKQSAGPVLELGCGTGRVAIPIAEAGVEVVGLDVSQAMLDVAKAKAADLDKLELVHGDMRDFDLDRRFGLAIVPFRGFLSLLTVEDQRNTIFNVKRHLAPNGRLAFNVFVPNHEMLVQEGDVAYHLRDGTDPETGETLVVYHQSSYDNHNQIIDARIIVERLDGRGAVTEKLYRDFQLRYSFRWELQHLLETCGFEVVDLFGGFDGSPFDETSTEMVWVVTPSD